MAIYARFDPPNNKYEPIPKDSGHPPELTEAQWIDKIREKMLVVAPLLRLSTKNKMKRKMYPHLIKVSKIEYSERTGDWTLILGNIEAKLKFK
jgi:hypothetical protein